MESFKKDFPLLQRVSYLNSASSGLLSESVLEFRQNHDLDFLILGSEFRDRREVLLAWVRAKVGSFFDCAPERVALTPNFSLGFNHLLEGVAPKKKLLLLDKDYPSINWAVESRNYQVVYAVIDQHLEDHIWQAVEKERPDLMAFSMVQYLNGIKIKESFLHDLKQNFPDMLLVGDGTQFCGTKEFRFDQSPLDVLGASGYKWLNAGYGNAFFLFKEEVAQTIFPQTMGFNSLQGRYKPQEGNFIGRFEPGHQDTLAFGSLGKALELLERIGISTVEKRISALSAYAKSRFQESGWLQDSVAERETHSSIFNLRIKESYIGDLKEQNILCSARGGGVRVGFHYFNSEREVDQFIDTVKSLES